MKLPFALLLSLVCWGCAVTREQAVASATREVARRHLPLPKHYTVEVKDSMAFDEVNPGYPIYVVTFSAPGNRTQKRLYQLNVDRRSGTIDDMSDLRDAVPLRN